MDKAKVKRWMRANYESHIDKLTGELNHTALSEECAYALNLYEKDGFTIPEEVFEIALTVMPIQ
jgi:hypothetical protein